MQTFNCYAVFFTMTILFSSISIAQPKAKSSWKGPLNNAYMFGSVSLLAGCLALCAYDPKREVLDNGAFGGLAVTSLLNGFAALTNGAAALKYYLFTQDAVKDDAQPKNQKDK